MTKTLKNDTRLDDLKSLVRELGRESASGRDAKAKLALQVVRAAYDGVIGPDEVEMIYQEYASAESKKAIHDHSAGGLKANVSKLRQVVALGCLPQVDGPELLDKVTDIRDELRGTDEKLKAAFDAFVDVSRAQLKSPDYTLDDDALRALCVKPESADKDIIQKLAEDYKRMSKRFDEFPSSAVEAAVHAIGDAIKEAGGELPPVTKEEKAKAAFIKRATSYGMTVSA